MAAIPITGLVLTKMDGSAKGGAVLAIERELSIPIKLIGTGEKASDLENFEPSLFLDRLLAS
jgi:fused signal recognition particle receptor